MPAYTLNETTKLFLTHIWELIKYWNLQDVHDNKKLEGLAFSILTLLDGNHGIFPHCNVIVDPHPSDPEFHIAQGEKYFMTRNISQHSLHELFHNPKALDEMEDEE